MVELKAGDCRELLKAVPDGSIDLICTDPPYKVTSRGNAGTMSGYWTSDLTAKGKIFEDNDIDPAEYASEFYRVLKDTAHCYVMCNHINLQCMLNVFTDTGFHFVKSCIWHKNNKICGRYYMNEFEYILFFRKGADKPINDCGASDVIKVPFTKLKNPDGTNQHDTEKPVALMSVLIKASTQEQETVLDPFMGIGSCGVACVGLNRNFIGFEINPKYFGIAQSRIAKSEDADW